MKKCSKCKETKELEKFYVTKSGVNKGQTYSYCIKCKVEYEIERKKVKLKIYPWYRTYRGVVSRCCSNGQAKKYYKGKGIKNLLKLNDLKSLWFRDKAYLLTHPSIDRINSNGDYTIDNCRYIEISENTRRIHDKK